MRGSVELSSEASTTVVALVGEFDLAVQDVLVECLESLQRREPRQVVVDLTAATFIDSTVINSLMAAHRDGLEIVIRGASGVPRRALEMLAIPGLPLLD